MQVRHVRSVLPATDGPLKVSAISWSPNSTRLAIATADRVVSLYDENGDQRKDKFSTKPVRAAAFFRARARLCDARYRHGSRWPLRRAAPSSACARYDLQTLIYPPTPRHPLYRRTPRAKSTRLLALRGPLTRRNSPSRSRTTLCSSTRCALLAAFKKQEV